MAGQFWGLVPLGMAGALGIGIAFSKKPALTAVFYAGWLVAMAAAFYLMANGTA